MKNFNFNFKVIALIPVTFCIQIILSQILITHQLIFLMYVANMKATFTN